MIATEKIVTYKHWCDMCGAECDRKELHRLAETEITESSITLAKPQIDSGKTCEICPACRSRLVGEVLAYLAPATKEGGLELAHLRAATKRTA